VDILAERAASGHAGPVGWSLPAAAATGAAVGVLGGLIGLGGAEFRLPLLITMFGFVALQAVIVNKAMSLIVVLARSPRACSASRSTSSRRTGRPS